MAMQYTLSLKNTFVSIVDEVKSVSRRTLSRRNTFDCLDSCCHDASQQDSYVEFEIGSDLTCRSQFSGDFGDLTRSTSQDSLQSQRSETTVMLRNIPNRYTQEWLVEEVGAVVPGIDFVYLPINFNKKNTNLGYAFVNFMSASEAEQFMEVFEGYKFQRQSQSLKRAQISYAKVQGKQANVAQYAQRAAEGVLKFWVR